MSLTSDFWIRTKLDHHVVAQTLCHEMSTALSRLASGSEVDKSHTAQIVELNSVKPIPFEHDPELENQYFWLRVGYPLQHLSASLSQIWSAFAGEGAFYCPGIDSIRWDDIHLPDDYLSQFAGPRFGLVGLREKLGIHERPFFVGVVKPNLGIDPHTHATLACDSWQGGLDIAKDDEMLVDPAYCRFNDRMLALAKARKQLEQKQQQQTLYIANITDDGDAWQKRLELCEQLGFAVMINTWMTGLTQLRTVARAAHVPLFGHFTGMALYHRVPGFGISPRVLVKMQRLAGCDGIILPGFGARMHMLDDDVYDCVAACLEPWGSLRPSLPIPGGSDWAGKLAPLFEKLKHSDFGFIAGRGIFAHPEGAAAGAKSLHLAWDAIQNHVPFEHAAANHPILAQAIKQFGGQRAHT